LLQFHEPSEVQTARWQGVQPAEPEQAACAAAGKIAKASKAGRKAKIRFIRIPPCASRPQLMSDARVPNCVMAVK
jgi:hypothetical protein